MDTFFVYILHSKTVDKYYIGHTNDIQRRLLEHNDPLANNSKFCGKNGPWQLVYLESNFPTRSDAALREKQMKAWKSRKKIVSLIGSSGSVGIPILNRD
jgi:putative endonuclease